MPVLSRVSENTLKSAKALRALYEPAVPPRPRKGKGKGQPAELTVTIASPVFDRVSIGFTLDGAFAGEEPFIPRTPGQSLGALAGLTGRRTLGVQVHGAGRLFHFTGPIDMPAEGDLRVEVWSRLYPPRILLDGEPVNPAPGLRYVADAGAPCPGPGDCPLVIVDTDRKPWDPPPADAEAMLKTLQVWIDGEPASLFNAGDIAFAVPVLCRAGLSAGLHQMRIGDPVAGCILLDTDILLDGAREVRIDVAGRREVTILEAGEVIFQQAPEPPFRQGSSPTNLELDNRREIHGIPLPTGIEGYFEEIEEQIRFSRAMVENFKTFNELKASARRKKAAGQPLTPAEQAVDAIKDYNAMDAWIRKRKEEEYGWKLRTQAQTNGVGEVEYVGPPPSNPFDELSRREALDIHEPSHVLDTDVLSLEFDIDLKKLARWRELKNKPLRELARWLEEAEKAEKAGLPPPPPPPIGLPGMDPEENALDRWYKLNEAKIRRYLEALADPERGARAEIREYTADAEFWEAVREYLRGQNYGWVVTDMALNIRVGKSREIRVEQIPDAPPRVRVIEGDAHVEVSPTERTRGSPSLGWGQFDIKVRGKSPGKVKIELTCGTLRKVIVINVY